MISRRSHYSGNASTNFCVELPFIIMSRAWQGSLNYQFEIFGFDSAGNRTRASQTRSERCYHSAAEETVNRQTYPVRQCENTIHSIHLFHALLVNSPNYFPQGVGAIPLNCFPRPPEVGFHRYIETSTKTAARVKEQGKKDLYANLLMALISNYISIMESAVGNKANLANFHSEPLLIWNIARSSMSNTNSRLVVALLMYEVPDLPDQLDVQSSQEKADIRICTMYIAKITWSLTTCISTLLS